MPLTKALTIQLPANIQREQVVDTTPMAPVEVPIEEVETLEAEEVKPNNTYTFSNGFTVNTGFVLNDQQRNALKTLEQFVNNPAKFGHTITLSGYAGTGKTTIMKFLHAYLEALGEPPVYAAPTNKAAAVTVENNPYARSMTINKLLNLPVFYDPTQDKLDLSKLKMVTEDMHLPEGVGPKTVVIIDESSMIDDSLLEAINMVRPFVRGIIFMGDAAQLSPVQHEDGRKSRVFEGANTLELTKVERTGDNPVLKECTNLRNGLPLTYQTHVVNGQGVVYRHNTDVNGIKLLLSQIISSTDESNNNAFRICCGTNNAVQQMNDMVREIMFGDAKAPIHIGEIITAYDNVGSFMNSVDYVVSNIGQERTQTFRTRFGNVTANVQDIVLNEIGAKMGQKVTVLALSNDQHVYNQIAAINKQFHAELNNPMLRRDTFKYMELRKEFAQFRQAFASMKSIVEDRRTVVKKQFDFGYALTVHKSQGSTYDQVMFHEPSVENAKFLESTKQQLKYVAVSRARSKVYVLTDNEVQQEVKQLDTPKLTKTKTDVTRAQAMRNPKTLYIFTDNTNRTSGKTEIDPESWYSQKYRKTVPLRYPSQTSAMLRGLDNARPISTQHWYDKASGKTRDAGRWNDSDFAEFKKVIDEEIQDIKEAWDSGQYDNVVIATPAGILRTAQNAGISGMSRDRVPKLFDYLHYKMKELDAHINGRQFNETYEEKQQSNDSVITGNASTPATNPSEFTNHSGGAKGADYFGWDQIGQEFGLTNHKHYYTGDRNDNNAPYGNIEITTEDYEEGRYKVAQAAKRNYGYEYKTMKDSRLIRNWSQVKYADAIFAIGIIVQPGEKLFPNKPGDTRVALAPSVTGGTGYAVGMAINEGKPVHVFDQSKKSWFVWDGKQFVQEDTPTLTKNFAGIGTRQLTEVGKQAIRDVYTKTFGSKPVSQPTQLDLFEDKATINVYSRDDNGYRELSNFSIRPFTLMQKNGTTASFKSVEQAFQFTKAMFIANNAEVAAKILASNNSGEIKQLGRSVPMTAEQIAKWNRLSTDLMYRLMKASFMQNASAKQLLLSTGDAVLTHKNERGQEQDGGRFSKLLMQIRDEIRQMEQEGNEDLNNCKTR